MAKILVIDDDLTLQLVIRKALQSQAHDLTFAVNGQEGIELAQQIQPALIICDWMMPIVDGLKVCRQVKANLHLSTTFFILLTSRDGIADRVQGLNTGADDFLAKPIDVAELQARVQAGLRLHQLSQDLQMQKQLLEAELSEAADYVRSLLPVPISGAISTDARFIPSRHLGGDCFDYFWLDPDYLVMYLLDVSGHGLGAALPSIVVLNLLRSQSLPGANFYQPHSVLEALNEVFQMGSQNQKYFTIWYGVYNRIKRQLTYASAGHPPAILLTPALEGSTQAHQLSTPCLPVGILTEAVYVSDRQTIPENSTLYLFSDGIYELNHPSNKNWQLDSFIKLLTDLGADVNLDHILRDIQRLSETEVFNDDLSLLRLNFS